MPGVNPLGSLRNWDLIVSLGGREYTLRPATAEEWLSILLEPDIDLSDILPGMLDDEDQSDLEETVFAGQVTEEELTGTALEVLTEAAGRDWWWALKLITFATGAWSVIYGRLLTQGIDPAKLTLGAFLDAMYLTCVQNMSKENRSSFDRELEAPPPGVAIEEAINEEAESASFLSMMNQKL